MPEEDAPGEYHMARLRGKEDGLLGSQPMEGVPPVWNTYVTVTDPDRDGRVRQGRRRPGVHGAVRRHGRRPDGRPGRPRRRGVHGLQAEREHRLRARSNQPGTFSSSQLHTPDLEGPEEFYGKVFWLEDGLLWTSPAAST